MTEQSIFELILESAAQTRRLGLQLAASVQGKAVIALVGPMGTGKTTLAQGVGEGLGLAEVVNSPTFTMINEYTTGRLPFYHLDLYRLAEGQNELNAQEIERADMLQDELSELGALPGVILVEWAELLSDYIAQLDCVWIELNYSKSPTRDDKADAQSYETGRVARITARGQQASKIVERIRNVYFS